MNKSYNIEIKVLSPVHIWDWNTISWIDYFCYKEKLPTPYKKNSDWKDIKNISFLYKFKIQNFIDILNKFDNIEFKRLLELWTDTLGVRNFIYKKLIYGKLI